jgi:hypothetical protein
MAALKRRWQNTREQQISAITVGELVTHRVDVFCWCNRCSHHATLPAQVLMAQFGPDFPVPEVGVRLRCSGCGAKDIATRPNWPSLGLVARHD